MHSLKYTYPKYQSYQKLHRALPPLFLTDEQLYHLSLTMIEHKMGADSKTTTNGEATFGQLLAHDITLENTSTFKKTYHPKPLINQRSISLDLDSMYGLRTESYFYQKKAKSKLLLNLQHDDSGNHHWYDLPRNSENVAIIPDHRDDESILVSRIHVLMMQFHNHYVDHFLKGKGKSEAEKFIEARRQVTWHYHWLIVHHYLYKVLDKTICDDILTNGPKYYTEPSYLPLEFTGAAFRIGHSQSREVNQLNEFTKAGIFDLGSFDQADVFVDWSYLFDLGDGKVEYAKKIDTKIAKAFHEIPFLKDKTDPRNASLPFRNLKRGVVYGLASGEAIAQRMCLKPLEIPETKELCLPGTPLWFYILKEAEILNDGEYLGPVGSRIFGEVFFTILKNDPNSYLVQHPKWEPSGLGNEKGVFGFKELINFICR